MQPVSTSTAFNEMPAPWLSVLLLSGIMLMLWAISYWQDNAVLTALALTPERVHQGAVWQLLSAHAVHFTFSHVAMNIAVFLVATYALHPKLTNTQMFYCIGTMSFALGLLLCFYNPEYSPYAGFSGTLHGYLALALCRSEKFTLRVKTIALGCLAIKIGYEQSAFFAPSKLQQSIEAEVAIDAHLYGALLGLLVALFFAAHNRYAVARTI